MHTTSHRLTEDIILWSRCLLDEEYGGLSKNQRQSIDSILQSAQDFLHLWCEFCDHGISQPRLALMLRDPLTVIMGYAVLLNEGMEGELNVTQQNFIQQIYRASAVLHGELDMLYYAGLIA